MSKPIPDPHVPQDYDFLPGHEPPPPAEPPLATKICDIVDVIRDKFPHIGDADLRDIAAILRRPPTRQRIRRRRFF